MDQITEQISQLLREFDAINPDGLPADDFARYVPEIQEDYKHNSTAKFFLGNLCGKIAGTDPFANQELYDVFRPWAFEMDKVLHAHEGIELPDPSLTGKRTYPKDIHFCSDYSLIWWHYRPLRERFAESDPKSYIGNSINLLLASLLTDEGNYDDGYIQGVISRTWTVNEIEQWLLDPNPSVPRAVRVTLWLSLDIVCGDVSGFFYSEEMYSYLLNEYLDELKSFVLNSDHNVFLSNHLLNFARWQFGYVERLWLGLPYLDRIRKEFYVLHPIFFPYYMFDNFMGIEVDFDAKYSAIWQSIKDRKLAREEQANVAQPEPKPIPKAPIPMRTKPKTLSNWDRVLIYFGLKQKPKAKPMLPPVQVDIEVQPEAPTPEPIKLEQPIQPKPAPPKPDPSSYSFDPGFFDRLKEEAQLLRPGMKVLDYLLWYGEHNYRGRQAEYDHFIVWLRDHGFEFEGDDPLGLKDLADQWKNVNQSPKRRWGRMFVRSAI